MILPSLKQRGLRDLLWALSQVPMFSSIPGFQSEWFTSDYVDNGLHPWLLATDQKPDVFLEHMSRQRSTRLGIYFEQLLSFYFQHYPRFELLAQNHQVHNQQRTIGEFDFIIYDHKDKQLKHIESAIKFYLGHHDNASYIPNNKPFHNWQQWVGPNHKDTLGIKMRHLQEHQLPLAKNLLGQESLSTITSSPTTITSRLLFSGRFFFPARSFLKPPLFCRHIETNNTWLSSDDFLNNYLSINSDRQFCYLPRQYWLSPLTKLDLRSESLALHSAEEAITLVNKEMQKEINDWLFAEVSVSDKDIIEKNRFFVIHEKNTFNQSHHST